MGNNCSCLSKDDRCEITVDKKPGTRYESSAPPTNAPADQSTLFPCEKWSLADVSLLQNAFRNYVSRKCLRPSLQRLVYLEWLEEPDAVSIKQENYTSERLPLTPEADDKRKAVHKFVYSLPVVGGDWKSPVLLSDESVYEGQWKDGKRFGRGVCYLGSGALMEGYWSNGLHLKGRTIFQNGDMYEGDYVHMRKEGRGRFEDFSSRVSYEGEWLQDQKHGYGIEKLPDGSTYEGYFASDNKSGRGKFIWASGEMYEGEFRDNKIDGFGKYVWNEGKWYEGMWSEGAMHGHGHLVQEGKDYVGEFVRDRKQGRGVLKWEGNVYEGEFYNNKMHGKGLLSQKGKPAKLYAFDNNKRGAVIEDAPTTTTE